MKRAISILWLLLTLVPIVFFFGFMKEMIFSDLRKEEYEIFTENYWFFMLFSQALFLAHVVLVFLLDSVPRNLRLPWVLAILFLNMGALPVFWYLYSWRPLSRRQRVETATRGGA